MAHKTLINGTQYGIKGGKTLISGTSYSVKNGKTLIGGTGYDVNFVPTPEASTLNGCSWANISEISEAGLGESYFSVGDTKAVTISGGTIGAEDFNTTTLYVYILGFNHNSDIEGTGITFGTFKTAQTGGIDVCWIDSYYSNSHTSGTKCYNMNHWGKRNYSGWKGCDLRYDVLGSTDTAPSGYGSAVTTSRTGYDASVTCATSPVANTLMAALPSDLRAVMKPKTIYSDNTGGGSDTASYVTASVDYLPLLAEFEVHGARNYANSAEKNYQAQYTYYSNGNSKVKYRHSATSATAYWWVRSPGCSYNTYFCYVGTSGVAGINIGASTSYGLAPIFLV